MIQQKFIFNKRFEYNVDVLPSKIAIWEAYKPFLDDSGIFSIYEKDSFTSQGSSLSSKIRLESLYNNLNNHVKINLYPIYSNLFLHVFPQKFIILKAYNLDQKSI